MTQTVEQLVSRYEAISRKLRREHNTPAKSRAFLVKVGILVMDRKSPAGVRLAKRFR